MIATGHAQCVALSDMLRGELCDQLAGTRAAQRLAPGHYLYTAGEAARSIFYVRSGLLKTSIISEDGREMILRMHKPHEILGELCFCDGRRREQAVAIEDSELIEIPLDDLMLQMQKDHQILAGFMALMGRFLADSYDKLPTFFFQRTMERLVQMLMKLGDELGEPFGGGIKIAHHIKQEELAAMIGAPRQVVSGLLNQLRGLRLVSYERKGFLTFDKEALKHYLRSIK
jgi:CRP-like cAMP-binding protein